MFKQSTHSAEGEAYTPTAASGIASNLPTCKKNTPFFFTHPKGAYQRVTMRIPDPDHDGKGEPELIEQTVILPLLKKFWIRPGCNGVRKRGRVPDPSVALMTLEKQGHTIIPHDVFYYDGSDGKPAGGYLLRFPTARGGHVHVSRWEHLVVDGLQTEIEHDDQGFNEFKLALVKAGYLRAPDERVRARLIKMLRNRHRRNLQNAHLPHAAEELKRTELAIADTERADLVGYRATDKAGAPRLVMGRNGLTEQTLAAPVGQAVKTPTKKGAAK